LDGLERAAVVADAVPLLGRLETGSPAMAVRSSVADEDDDEDVVVAFRAPETTVAAALPDKFMMLVGIRLLGRREVEAVEELWADKHCASKAQRTRILVIIENIRMKIGMLNEWWCGDHPTRMQAWYMDGRGRVIQ
jgi:hypothetical protein